jgi:hypothetical protein
VRSRVFARQEGREVVLSDGHASFARLPLAPDMDACCAVESLQKLPEQGIRLRGRALMTTLFARLCLADLFVHGIGGAKYDEMTDRILARFFRVPVPGFMTLTGTLYLPIFDPQAPRAQDETRLANLLRDLEWNPQRHLDGVEEPRAQRLIAEKAALIAEQQVSGPGASTASERRQRRRQNYDRFRRIHAINREVAPLVADQRANAEAELAELHRQREADSVLRDRDYSAYLQPEERLRAFMDALRRS